MTRFELINTTGIYDVLSFGKYQGKTILWVLDNDPSYLVWCCENVINFRMPETVKKELLKQYDGFKYGMRESKRHDSMVKHLMHNYGMHASEADCFIDEDLDNLIPNHCF